MTEIQSALANMHIDVVDPPVILWVHAFPLSGDMWKPQIEALSGYRHLVPDLPGFGLSPPVVDPLEMSYVADLLAAILDRVRVTKAIIVGLSMGGYIALAFAKRHPQRMKALILADTRATPDSEEGASVTALGFTWEVRSN